MAFSFLNQELAIDLGTANTIIFSRTQLLTPERVEKSRALVEEQG